MKISHENIFIQLQQCDDEYLKHVRDWVKLDCCVTGVLMCLTLSNGKVSHAVIATCSLTLPGHRCMLILRHYKELCYRRLAYKKDCVRKAPLCKPDILSVVSVTC